MSGVLWKLMNIPSELVFLSPERSSELMKNWMLDRIRESFLSFTKNNWIDEANPHKEFDEDFFNGLKSIVCNSSNWSRADIPAPEFEVNDFRKFYSGYQDDQLDRTKLQSHLESHLHKPVDIAVVLYTNHEKGFLNSFRVTEIHLDSTFDRDSFFPQYTLTFSEDPKAGTDYWLTPIPNIETMMAELNQLGSDLITQEDLLGLIKQLCTKIMKDAPSEFLARHRQQTKIAYVYKDLITTYFHRSPISQSDRLHFVFSLWSSC